jgi:predicted solute-binding protein
VAELSELTRASYEFGKLHLSEIVSSEYAQRGISHDLAGEYLRRYIRFEIGPAEQRGLETFFELAGLELIGLTEGARL